MAAMMERRVVIAYTGLVNKTSGEQQCSTHNLDHGQVFHLRHPKTGAKACYMLLNEKLQELHWFKQSYASWFIGDSVCEDGSLYLATPVDVIFIALPILEVARMKKGDDAGKFRDLDDLLYVAGFPGYSRLKTLLEKQLELVCDVRAVGSDQYYRLNDERVLAWLSCKVNRTVESLRLRAGKVFENMTEEDIRTYAVGLLSEYLQPDTWFKRLCGHYGVDTESAKKAKPSAPPQGELLLSLPPASAPQVSKQASATGKGKTMGASKKGGARASAGSDRKITSFFAKPR